MLDVKEFEELGDLEMDGTAEWTAMSLELPQESFDNQLACLLLCKGVQKSQVGVTTYSSDVSLVSKAVLHAACWESA